MRQFPTILMAEALVQRIGHVSAVLKASPEPRPKKVERRKARPPLPSDPPLHALPS